MCKPNECHVCGGALPSGITGACVPCIITGGETAMIVASARVAEREQCCQDVCIYCATDAIEEAWKDSYSGLWRHNIAPCGPGEPDNRFKPCAAAAIHERAAKESDDEPGTSSRVGRDSDQR